MGEDVLRNQSDRSLLQDVFGGDCVRLVKIQTMCESIELSAMNRQDQRLPTCINICHSMEKLLLELGNGEALSKAQEGCRDTIHDCGGLDGLVAGVSPSIVIPFAEKTPSSPQSQSGLENVAAGSDRIFSIVRADAERRETR